MIKNFAELVVMNMADVGRVATQVGESGDRVGDRATRHFLRRAHFVVDLTGAIFINQVHGAPVSANFGYKIVLDMSEDINDGIADA